MDQLKFSKIRLNKSLFFFYLLPLLLSTFIFFSQIYPSIQGILTTREMIVEQKKQSKKYRRKIKKLTKILKRGSRVSPELKNMIFTGNDPYVVISTLQKKIEEIPELSVRSFRLVKKEKIEEYFEKVVASFVITGDIKGLVELLWEIENEKKALRICRLSVSYRHYRKHEILNIILEIEGLFAQTLPS